MRIERKPFVPSNTLAAALHGFVHSTSFGDMMLSPLIGDIGRHRSLRATLSLLLASRTFVRSAGIGSAAGLRSFLGADAASGCGDLVFSPRFQSLARTRP